MAAKRKTPWLALLVGAGCVIVLCMGVLVVGGGAYFFYFQRSAAPLVNEAVITVTVHTAMPTAALPPLLEPTAVDTPTSPAPPLEPTQTPTTEPAAVEPTSPGPALTGEQYRDDYSFFDDFSSEALGWPIYDDGLTILSYENESYKIRIQEPDYYDWAFIPVDFIPIEIWFDAQGSAKSQDGTFGVFCQFQDEDNYTYVEFDLDDNAYMIGQILEGESILLTEANSDDNDWQHTSALDSSPAAVNRIGVSCYLESITLFINDRMVDEVNITQPFDTPGEAAFFVYAFDSAAEAGYEISIDNVEAYQPVQ